MQKAFICILLLVNIVVTGHPGRRLVSMVRSTVFNFKAKKFAEYHLIMRFAFGPGEVSWQTRALYKYDGDLSHGNALRGKMLFLDCLIDELDESDDKAYLE
jgi:hypothetical protein